MSSSLDSTENNVHGRSQELQQNEGLPEIDTEVGRYLEEGLDYLLQKANDVIDASKRLKKEAFNFIREVVSDSMLLLRFRMRIHPHEKHLSPSTNDDQNELVIFQL